MAASFTNWSPYRNYMQSGGSGPGMTDGKYVTGAFTGVFAGPPRLASLGGAAALASSLASSSGVLNQIVYPLGLIQNLNVSHNRQWTKVYEMGSERAYFISGRTVGQLMLSRMVYHGPSLLRTLYAYYQDLIPEPGQQALFTVDASVNPNPHDVIIPPGYENFYANLASDLFSQPVGLMTILKDTDKQTYGATYFESCVVPNHTIATDANGVLIQEQASLQFERAVALSASAISLIA